MKKCIYGVDTTKKITPLMVRDAIIECFLQAHDEELEQMREYGKIPSEKTFAKLKRINITALIKKTFEEIGEDFNEPTKSSMLHVIERLEKLAANFRNQELISKHEEEILILINKLP